MIHGVTSRGQQVHTKSQQNSTRHPLHLPPAHSQPDGVELSQESHGRNHRPNWTTGLMGGFGKGLEGTKVTLEAAEKTEQAIQQRCLDAVKHGSKEPGRFAELGGNKLLQGAAKYAPIMNWGSCLKKDIDAINNPNFSPREKSKEVWGAVEGLGIGLGVAGGMAGEKWGESFGEWLVSGK
ncbi:hypothetical protein IV102_15945 [bacterium]|nr:hypothetical protein [bacterium]